MTLLAFAAQHALLFGALILTATAAGTAVIGDSLSFRAATGLAVLGYAFFFAALAGVLRQAVVGVPVIAFIAAAFRFRRSPMKLPPAIVTLVAVVTVLAAFVLSLFPPLAFDETLYHLPFVRALATTGTLAFRADMRFPVFPQFHELLCVPLFLAHSDAATHLVALAETILTAALLWEWGSRKSERTGALAAAFFAGSPIVLHLATITYVDAALTLFVCAAFYCLDRGDDVRWQILAGVFLGAACSTKYLGWYFAVAALLVARRRLALAVSFATAALPVTWWLFASSGDPLFPYLSSSPWSLPGQPVSLATQAVRLVRLPFDVTFVRSHMNFEPPFTPFFIVAIIAVAIAAFGDRRARAIAVIALVYFVIFTSLPQDSRYLVPLLPLLSIGFAEAVADRVPKFASLVAIAPTIAYAAYVLVVRGLPPATSRDREALLRRRIPAYAALQHATGGVVYVCGGEQLKYYARAGLVGDFNGPFSYDRVLGSRKELETTGAGYFLAVKAKCDRHPPFDRMRLVYEDGAAQLWELQRSQSGPSSATTR